MKLILRIYLLIALAALSCSPKYKTSRKELQSMELKLKKLLYEADYKHSLEKDSSLHFFIKRDQHLQTWKLKGQVMFLADGSIHAEEADVEIWTEQNQLLEETKKEVLQNFSFEFKKEETEEIFSEKLLTETHSKPVFRPYKWVLRLGLILLILALIARGVRKSFRFF